jgi:hypothetical protein
MGSHKGRSPKVTVALRQGRNDTRRSFAPWIGWSLWVLVVALSLLAAVPFGLANDALPAVRKPDLVTGVFPTLAFGTVGAVIVSRRPSNAVGWLCCAVALGQSFSTFGGQGARAILAADPGRIPGGLVLYQLGSLAWESSWVLLGLLLLVFPNGRLPSRRWRPTVWAAIAAAAGSALSAAFLPGPVEDGLPANPLGIEPLEHALRLAYGVNAAVLAAVLLAGIVSLVVRFRWAAGAERQQLKWFAYGVGLLALLPVAGPIAVAAGPVAGALVWPVLLSGVPVAIGVAVLKYRLYDIDRIINRTLVYGLLTAVLGIVYAGVVLVLGEVSGGIGAESPTWAVAGATLAAAVLFQPARSRIQHAVDRRFNRRKHNAAQTIEAFSTRLRDQIDLDTLSSELLATVDRRWSQPMSRSGSDPPHTAQTYHAVKCSQLVGSIDQGCYRGPHRPGRSTSNAPATDHHDGLVSDVADQAVLDLAVVLPGPASVSLGADRRSGA